MTARALRTLLAAAPLAAFACTGEAAPLALGEPLRVPAASFKPGALPGTPPTPDAGAAAGPRLTSLQTISGIAFAGQVNKVISGRTTRDAVAIAVRFADAGSGYWVQPLGPADQLNGGELTFEVHVDFADSAPLGNQALAFAAIDAAGAAGEQSQVTLCVDGVIPDNFNVCAPQLPPPAVVLSLSWDTPADLDLQVTTPDGKVVDTKHPTTAPMGSTAAQIAAAGRLDIDAQAGCRGVGPRRENLIWQKPPVPGSYQVRVNLFDACGAASARFAVTLYTSQPDGDGGTGPLVAGQQTVGVLLGTQANGGAAAGLYIGDVGL